MTTTDPRAPFWETHALAPPAVAPDNTSPRTSAVHRMTPLPPEEEAVERLKRIRAAGNPLLEASQLLLRALADMPEQMTPPEITAFRRLLEEEVMNFQAICGRALIRHEHVVAASYALCTAIDEAASRTAWGGGGLSMESPESTSPSPPVAAPHAEASAARWQSAQSDDDEAIEGEAHEPGVDVGVWAGRQLAMQFHGDNQGGKKVFLLVGRLAASPAEHIDLLELLFFVLGLGFEGQYGLNAANSRRQLDTIRHRLYQLVHAARGDVPTALSPHLKGAAPGRFKLSREVPVWLTALVAMVAVVGLFAWYSWQLQTSSRDVVARIRAIGLLSPPAGLAPRKALRLKELLAAEIASGSVGVQEDALSSTVSFRGDDMFIAGQSRMNAAILPVIAKVAGEINEVAGTVRVVGHSDNQPIRTRKFPDNLVLSRKRAAAVAEVLLQRGVAPSRIAADGLGDTQPVATNATAPGRAKNRRVDIIVTQTVE
ncbi:MAG: type VI secretion system protein TssL [Comamonadaceae bacterium]|nr:MAG: type VI secretion system protein TssL [Comamonadaceae bacterium]